MLLLEYFNNNFKIESIHLVTVYYFFLLLSAFKGFLILNCVEFLKIKLIGLGNNFAISYKKINHIFRQKLNQSSLCNIFYFVVVFSFTKCTETNISRSEIRHKPTEVKTVIAVYRLSTTFTYKRYGNFSSTLCYGNNTTTFVNNLKFLKTSNSLHVLSWRKRSAKYNSTR